MPVLGWGPVLRQNPSPVIAEVKLPGEKMVLGGSKDHHFEFPPVLPPSPFTLPAHLTFSWEKLMLCHCNARTDHLMGHLGREEMTSSWARGG